jgi:tetratricopeptide (TPR) repeat protein
LTNVRAELNAMSDPHHHHSDQGERLRAVGAALREGDMARASELAIAALAAGDEHPALLNLRALRLEEAGRLDEALADLERARALAPADFSIPNAIGLCLARMNRMGDAVAAFDAALALNPDFAPAHYNRGWALEPLGELAEARRAYERAVELMPDHAEALAHLAALAARRSDFEAARAFALRALALKPGQPTAETALASAELGEGEPGAAEARLAGLIARPDVGPVDRAIAEGQRGDALDALDRTADAFAAYARSNAELRAVYAPRFEAPGAPTVSGMLAWLIDYFKDATPREWSDRGAGGAPDMAGERGHVFLLGFPRTGTTLAENALAAHPDVVSLEERETLQAALSDFMRGAESLDRLAKASSAALDDYRRSYWDVVHGFGVDPAGKVFVDKNPFNTVKLPLIAKLFPDARIIFALRDPRDVVFSCFRRRFGINGSTYEYLALEGTARAYDLTMSLAETLRPVLGLAEHRLVYERLVEDFEAEMRAVCDFVGLDWTPAMGDFTGRAREGRVATASSGQVSRALYREGAGQWRRYRAELAPVMAALAPWAARFGYPAD